LQARHAREQAPNARPSAGFAVCVLPGVISNRAHTTPLDEEETVSDVQAITDRVEIEALRGEFTDALMMRDYDRFAWLFTDDATWRIPDIDAEFVGREAIRAGVERLQGLWDCAPGNPAA
jgi:hypothetical protein